MPRSHPFDRYAPFTDIHALKEASARPLRKSFRVNTLKTSVEAVLAWGREKGWDLRPVPWCPEGFFVDRVERDEALGRDLLHLLGHIYIQEAASMLPVALLDPKPGEAILDLCAAPGSKTTQIAALMRASGVLVASDVQEKRLWTLKAALHRLGVTNAIVLKKVGQWFSKHMTERFDRVLCDAPCTAQGTVRKDTDALLYASEENTQKMARLQTSLLEAAVHAAKVGGRIVYSTCTLTPEENEGVVLTILNKYCDQLEVLDPCEGVGRRGWGLGKAIEDSHIVQKTLRPTPDPLHPCVRLWPQTEDTEGFFCAVLRKKAPTRAVERMEWRPFVEERLPAAREREVGDFLAQRYGSSFLREGDALFERGEHLLLASGDIADFPLPVSDYALGLPFARRAKEGRVLPTHELATLRGAEATKQICDLDEAQIAALLRGQDTICPPQFSGHVFLRFRSLCVGHGIAKEGRLKNNLPRWMILR